MSRRLGEILVDAKVLSEHAVAEALDRQRGHDKRLGAVLIEMGLVDEQTVVAALSEQFQIPVAALRDQGIDEDAVARLPEQVARIFQAAPIRLTPLGLEVAVADALDPSTLARLESAAGTPILPRLTTAAGVCAAVDASYRASGRHRRRGAGAVPGRGVGGIEVGPNDHRETGQSAVPEGFRVLVAAAMSANSSDVFIERHLGDTQVLLRVDGVLQPLGPASGVASPAIDLAGLAYGSDERRQLRIDGRLVEVVIATLAGSHGERTHLRLSYRDDGVVALDHLGMPPHVLRSVDAHLHRSGGLLLVTGGRRSGRSTTLDAMAAAAASGGRAVIEARNPGERGDLEGCHPPPPGVFQVSVPMNGLAVAIEAQDPDVVMIDDADDPDKVRVACQLAAGGATVIAAVVAPDPTSAITRVISMSVDRCLLAAVLRAVFGQGVARRSPPTFEVLEVDEIVRCGVRHGLAG